MSVIKKAKNIRIYLFLLVCSVLFVTVFSYSTSPLFPYYFGGDSAQFLTVGKAWESGAIPYRDMFDHKGPIIFFVNMLGYLIAGNKFGVWAIQIVFMIFTLIAVWKIATLVEDSGYYTVVSVLVFLSLLLKNYVDGDLTEEYCLPFIAYSLYGLNKYFQENEIKHSPRQAFFYGITVSICFLTRVTNAISVCVGVAIVTIILLASKQFENLKKNTIAFLIGFFIISLPFIVYFGLLGEMKSFLHGTIFYNIEYSKNMTPWVIGASGEKWKTYLLTYLPAWSIFITAVLAFTRKSWRVGFFYVCLGLAENILFFKGALYSQYGMIALPQIVFLLNELVLLKSDEGQKVFKYCAFSIMAVFCSTIMMQKIQTVPDLHNSFKEYSNRGWEELMAYIPEDEKNSFVAYGGNEFKELYLTENILPCYKYFVIQEWHAQYSENMRKNIHDQFATGEAKWILTDENVSTIKDVLDNEYIIVAVSGPYTMYSKK